METWEIQAERKRTESEPRDWDTYRRALISSGMVEESRFRREYSANVRESAERDLDNYEARRENPHVRSLVDALYEEKHGGDT